MMRRRNRTKAGLWMLAALSVAAGAELPGAARADDQNQVSVSSMSIDARRNVERRVDEVANRIANSKSFFEEDHLPIHIKSQFDPVGQSLLMEVDERFGPVSGYVEMENLQSEIANEIWPMLENIHGIQGLDWRYGGKDLYFWFPGDRREPEKSKSTKPTSRDGLGSVLINDGHGYYYHHGFHDWRFQREPANGIIEDRVTSEIATPLWAWLSMDGVAVKTSRESSFGNHEPSGKPLYLMAARYLLERSLPERPDIWHSLPDDVSDLREYREDIRSRPLFANALGVDAMISIHTNASDNASVRGTRVFSQPGRPESAEFASMALCYMREHIHASKAYEDFAVAPNPQFSDKGENRLADMPAIIVELGFHTNAEDAAALKDPLFVGSAMRGLAKAYRLFRNGERCEEFAVRVPDKAESIVGDVTKIPITWTGYPDYPMSVSAERGWAMVPEAPAEQRVDLGYQCLDDDVGRSPFALKVVGRDFAGIETKPAEIIMSCLPRPEIGVAQR